MTLLFCTFVTESQIIIKGYVLPYCRKSVSLQKNILHTDKENIIGIVKELTASERVQFIELLNEYTLADKIVSVANTVNQNRQVSCPHCCNTDIYGHGTYRGRSRYKCKSCKKTFNDNTGTAIDGIKKVSEFQVLELANRQCIN